MGDPTKPVDSAAPAPDEPRVSPRVAKAFPLGRPPPWGFFKGLLTGAVIEVPILAAGVWVLARIGIGDTDVAFMRIIRLTAIFAGIAAVLTAAGLGRLAAQASVMGGRRHAAWVTGRAHAAASIGLLVIASIPHGHIPARGAIWLLYPLVGAVLGLVAGAMIGVVCGGAAPLRIGDVLSLAGRPIKTILSPEDLARLGAALRDRTSHLFEGMFEPAASRPDELKDVKKPRAPTPKPADPEKEPES